MSGASEAPGVEGLLAAGALLPAGTKVPKKEPVDRVGARAFTHDALGARSVVRLVPEALAPGVDLEMKLFGFGDPKVKKDVGLQRRRALGFPGWALVNDPERARFALDVLEDLEKAARVARSKPGNAKLAFDKMADKLQRSVPHFLPSYYEEIARRYVESGSQAYAAQYFGKARDAEKVHALEVDENQRRETFVEFALAGALTVKSLTDYGAELARSHEPQTAYDHFFELCTRRTLGGMPPWAGMSKDLRRLAAAAKLDRDAEDRRFVSAVIEAPPIVRAPGDFWTSYRPTLLALAKESAHLRAVLLDLSPRPSTGERGKFNEEWLVLLRESGALEAVMRPAAEVAAEAKPAGAPAVWFSKMLEHVSRGYRSGSTPDGMFALLRDMAPRLKADGIPVAFTQPRGVSWTTGPIDPDLCDLALELGIPVADPPAAASVHLQFWAEGKSSEHPRDPVHFAADPRFAPLLERGLDGVFGNEAFERTARGKKSLLPMRERWLNGWIDRAQAGALPAFEGTYARLQQTASRETYREFPAAHAKLAKIDPLAALQRTLRVGISDELGWPALDEVLDGMTEEARAAGVARHGAFPYMIVLQGLHATVIGPSGVLLRHDLQVPKGANLQRLRYAGGQLLVRWWGGGKHEAYWSGAPSDVFADQHAYGMGEVAYGVELDDGGITEGQRAYHPGDREVGTTAKIAGDGTTLWRMQWADGKQRLFEYDPRTGEKGRASLPRFYESWAETGWRLAVESSELLPAPKGLETSPLGMRDGLLGWRVRVPETAPGTAPTRGPELERVDGARFVARPSWAPLALVDWPGDDARRPIFMYGQQWQSRGVAIADSEGTWFASAAGADAHWRRGASFELPLIFWHYLRPRDLEGSKALRSIDLETVKALVDAATEDRKAEGATQKRPRIRDVIAKKLPQVKHPRLIAGIVGVVDHAESIGEHVSRMVAERDPAASPAAVASSGTTIDPKQVEHAIRELTDWAGTGGVAAHIQRTSAFFEQGGAGRAIGEFATSPWETCLGRVGALGFKAIAPATPDAMRDAVLALVELWAGTIFVREPDKLRSFQGTAIVESLAFLPPSEAPAQAWLFEHGGNRYYLRPTPHRQKNIGQGVYVVEYAPTGKFAMPPGIHLASESAAGPSPETAEQLLAFVAAARSKGALPMIETAVDVLTEKTGRSRGEVALIYLAGHGSLAYQSDFLGKAIRGPLGIKTTDAKIGRDAWRGLSWETRTKLYSRAIAAAAGDPERLWDAPESEGSAASCLAAACRHVFGATVAVPEELLAAATKELATHGMKTVELLQAFPQPEGPKWLNADSRFTLGVNATISATDPAAFGGAQMMALANFVPWLFSELPVGHPFRNGIPRVHELVLERLRNPELLFQVGLQWVNDPKDAESKVGAMLDAIGGTPLPGEITGRDTGGFLAVRSNYGITFVARPAQLDAAGLVALRRHAMGHQFLPAIEALRSPGFAAIVERVKKTPVPAGGWETNPTASAPEVVDRVRMKHDLTADAAALHLQTLALFAPIAKDVQKWNDWTAARYKKAAAELVGRELVVEAKRARAGRAHFLPGGWENLKAPHVPIETWKLPLYGITRGKEGAAYPPLGRYLALQPIHEIFAAAWERVEKGDAPRYEDVK